MKLSSLLVAATLLTPLGVFAQTDKPADAPRAIGGRVANETQVTAVVQAVNAETRLVTLKGKDGNVVSFTAGPDVQNFDQIKVGDHVDMFLKEDVTIIVTNLPNEPERTDTVDVVRAAKGDKPAVLITKRSKGVAVIDAINYEKRTAVLRGAQRTVEIEADPEAKDFNKAKVGDRVFVDYVQSLFIMVHTVAP